MQNGLVPNTHGHRQTRWDETVTTDRRVLVACTPASQHPPGSLHTMAVEDDWCSEDTGATGGGAKSWRDGGEGGGRGGGAERHPSCHPSLRKERVHPGKAHWCVREGRMRHRGSDRHCAVGEGIPRERAVRWQGLQSRAHWVGKEREGHASCRVVLQIGHRRRELRCLEDGAHRWASDPDAVLQLLRGVERQPVRGDNAPADEGRQWARTSTGPGCGVSGWRRQRAWFRICDCWRC